MRVLPLVAILALLAACQPTAPSTITPPAGLEATGRTIDIPIDEPVVGTAVPGSVNPPPLALDNLVLYREPEGRFSINTPADWPAIPQSLGAGQTDAKLGYLFASPVGNGLLSVTHFDNGQAPTNIGNLATQVLELSGVTRQPGYTELGRTSVPEREGQALRVQLEYARSDGVRMQGAVLFQADGTTFSMVNLSVARDSWAANEGTILDILSSYRVPAVQVPPAP
jgi:hypothetical protein